MVTYTVEHNIDLSDLAKRCSLDEQIDYGCKFIVARNGSLAGVAGVNFNKEVYPRFEHIIVDPKYQKGSLGGRLMLRMEDYLRISGFYHYVSFIYHDKKMMIDYAIKFGMRPFGSRPKGIWFFKSIGGDDVNLA